MIRSRRKKAVSHYSPILGGREREVFLALEVMEEAALGEPGRFANIFDSCSGVAFGADHVESRVQKLRFRVMDCIGLMLCIHCWK